MRTKHPGSLARRASLTLCALVAVSACASAPKPAAPANPAQANGATPAATPAAAPQAPPPPAAAALWSAAPGEPLPAALAQTFAESTQKPQPGVALAPVGPLTTAGQALRTARAAFTELRCADAIQAIDPAAERLRAEIALPESRALLGDLYGLMLICADRLSDAAHAARAAAALAAIQPQLPPDVLLVLNRYLPPPLFGPARPPVQVETDPPGAMVLRNLVPVGKTPIRVDGGVPEQDTLDIEAPGLRKMHRPLGSGTQLVLSLRPEDRAEVLLDRAAALPLGSDDQGAALSRLSAVPAAALPARRILVVGPKQRGGQPVSGEALVARLYDLDQRKWLTPVQDIGAGPEPGQAALAVSLAQSGAAPGLPGTPGAVPAGAIAAPGKKADAKPEGKSSSIVSKLPFAKTRWYTWVIAGGVAALIAGLLISEKVSTDKVTITATNK